MDLKVYYQKLRQVEAAIPEPDVVVASLETSDGGRTGVLSEVARGVAARMIVEGKARLATEEESAAFRARIAEGRRAAEQLATAGRVQLTVLSEADLRALRAGARKG